MGRISEHGREVEVKKEKRKRKIAEQAREPIIKKARKAVEEVSFEED